MKRILHLILAAALALAAGSAPSQEKKSLQDVFQEAVKQYEAKQYQEALKGFQTVLKYQPNYIYARNYASKCLAAMREGTGPGQKMDVKLAAITLPSVEFQGTDLALVFDYLTQKSEELSGGKVVANFIYKGTDEEKKAKLVTLSLRNAPFTEVIRYVGTLTNTVFTYEEFAVVGTPADKVQATPATGPTTTTGGSETKFDEPFPKAPTVVDPFQKKKR